jgi:hypothetical protein
MIIEDMSRSVGAVLVLAALLRAPGLFSEFWLDEIHALSSATNVRSAVEVFTGIHHDSNHWLVSLWMNLVGPGAPFWVYRLPSCLAGIAAVLFAGWLAEAEGSKAALARLLAATSFPLVFYSSEARGYSLAALAALAFLLYLVRWIATGKRRFLLGSSIAAALGLLAHPSFLLVLAASMVYSLVLAARVGGGTSPPPAAVLLQTASLGIGGPVDGALAYFVAALAVLSLMWELARRLLGYWPNRASAKPAPLLWVFFFAAMFLPIWAAMVFDPPFLYPRYFLVLLVFVPLLYASFARSLPGPWLSLVVAVWLGLNGWSFARFLQEGRGSYEEALRFLLQSSNRDVVAIASDHDFRNGTVVRFYRERMGESAARVRYAEDGESADAEFWIGSYAGSQCPGCRLLRSYPSSSLSGARWRLYRTP